MKNAQWGRVVGKSGRGGGGGGGGGGLDMGVVVLENFGKGCGGGVGGDGG